MTSESADGANPGHSNDNQFYDSGITINLKHFKLYVAFKLHPVTILPVVRWNYSYCTGTVTASGKFYMHLLLKPKVDCLLSIVFLSLG